MLLCTKMENYFWYKGSLEETQCYLFSVFLGLVAGEMWSLSLRGILTPEAAVCFFARCCYF